jgi:hypothetical protein
MPAVERETAFGHSALSSVGRVRAEGRASIHTPSVAGT